MAYSGCLEDVLKIYWDILRVQLLVGICGAQHTWWLRLSDKTRWLKVKKDQDPNRDHKMSNLAHWLRVLYFELWQRQEQVENSMCKKVSGIVFASKVSRSKIQKRRKRIAALKNHVFYTKAAQQSMSAWHSLFSMAVIAAWSHTKSWKQEEMWSIFTVHGHKMSLFSFSFSFFCDSQQDFETNVF